MCIFSGTVKLVSQTRIFARPGEDGRELLAYSMTVDLDEPVAMILPLPVPPGSPDDAVRFIDLSGYENFFDELDAGFPPPPAVAVAGTSFGAPQARSAPLVVHAVGRFVASFVPSPKDFTRLDPRFRMPDVAWKAVPHYADWGFAVFELKEPGSKKVHPMAFEFPRRDPSGLFFPTVHIHDGAVHDTALFSHSLYSQLVCDDTFHSSRRPAVDFMNIDKAADLLLPFEPCFRRTMHGMFPNRDITVR